MAETPEPTRLDVPVLSDLSSLAARSFPDTREALEALMQAVADHLGLRSAFLARIGVESQTLEVVAAHNLLGGSDIQPGEAPPLSQHF